MHVTIAAFRSLVSMVGCTGTLISFPFLTVLQTSRAVVGKSRTYITVWFVVVMRNVPYAHKHGRVMFLQDYSVNRVCKSEYENTAKNDLMRLT